MAPFHSPSQHCQGWTSDNAAFEARVGVNAVPLNAPDGEDWKNKQAWLGATIFGCNKTFFHLYCLEI